MIAAGRDGSTAESVAGGVSLAAARAAGLGERLRGPRLPEGFLPEKAGRLPVLRTAVSEVDRSSGEEAGEEGRSGGDSLLTEGDVGGN